MTQYATPWILALALACAGIAFLVLIQIVNSGPEPRTRLLKANVWIVASTGCALTVLHREDPGNPLHAMILLGGTAAVCAIFLVAVTSAQGAVRGPHGGVVALAWIFTLTEVTYMVAAGNPASDHPEIVASLFFFPGIVSQVWLANSSREELLRLAYHVTFFVTAGSLAFGLMSSVLPGVDAPSDLRRFPVGPLVHRLSGLTPHPNYLSVTAVLCLLLAIQLKTRERFVVSLLCVSAIVAAESRTALASLFVAVFVLWVVRSRRPLARFVVVAPFVLIALIWSGALLPNLEADPLGADVSDNGRYRVWDSVWQGFIRDPWTGYGPLAFQPDSNSPYVSEGLLHAHNQILQAIAEAGWLGGALALLLLLSIVRIGVRNRATGLYPALAAVVVTNCITEPFMTMHLYGLNYAVVLPTLMWIVAMSAPIGGSHEHLRDTDNTRPRAIPSTA